MDVAQPIKKGHFIAKNAFLAFLAINDLFLGQPDLSCQFTRFHGLILVFFSKLKIQIFMITMVSRQKLHLPKHMQHSAVHRDAFCQFPFRWIYYCHSSKPTGKETGKMHLCALT